MAYLFLYLLFELVTEGAPEIYAIIPLGPAPLETLFILLLSALSASHIVQLALAKTPSPRDDHRGFIVLFLTYNVLAGVSVAEEAAWGALNLSFFVVAIGMHLMLNDLFLLRHHSTEHTIPWRFALGIAPILGCVLAISIGMPAGVLYISLALIAGGTLTSVFRHEMPGLEGFRATAFLVGVTVYAALIFANWRF